MPIPSEWDFRSLPNDDEITVQRMLVAGLVEKAPEVIFLQRTIESALSATLHAPAELGAHRDRAVADILLNFGKVDVAEPPVEKEPIVPGLQHQRETLSTPGVPVAGPQWPGQATPGHPIVSDSDSGRTLYTPIGPVRVGDMLEYWDTPSGPTSAETWQVVAIGVDGRTSVQASLSRGITRIAASEWWIGGPWHVKEAPQNTNEKEV